MVEALNNFNQQTQVKKDNTPRNVALTSVIGAAAGGAIGYNTKNTIKDGVITDEFVRTYYNLTNKSESEKLVVNFLLKHKGKEPTVAEVRKFFSKIAEIAPEEFGNVEDIKSMSDKEIMEMFNSESVQKGLDSVKIGLDRFQNNFSNTDQFKNAKKFSRNMFEESSSIGERLMKVQNHIKGKAGLLWALAAGIGTGATAYVVSKLNSNKN